MTSLGKSRTLCATILAACALLGLDGAFAADPGGDGWQAPAGVPHAFANRAIQIEKYESARTEDDSGFFPLNQIDFEEPAGPLSRYNVRAVLWDDETYLLPEGAIPLSDMPGEIFDPEPAVRNRVDHPGLGTGLDALRHHVVGRQ